MKVQISSGKKISSSTISQQYPTDTEATLNHQQSITAACLASMIKAITKDKVHGTMGRK